MNDNTNDANDEQYKTYVQKKTYNVCQPCIKMIKLCNFY